MLTNWQSSRCGIVNLCLAFAASAALAQPARFPDEFRTIDGTHNNVAHPEWGSAGIELLRRAAIAYADGTGAPAGVGKASPRQISSMCAAQPGSMPNSRGASDYLWQWGQFLDHDLDLTPGGMPIEPFDIPVPLGDPFFDPLNTGTQVIAFDRSAYRMVEGVRQQINVITAYIDASQVYGSDEARVRELRALDGTGRLKTSTGELPPSHVNGHRRGPKHRAHDAGDLLPFNVNGLPNGPSGPDPTHFLAGDERANEQVALTAMHTLFMREHNYWADQFHHHFHHLDDETIYQMARVIVAAEMQAITYHEWLPVLLGSHALRPYTGYQPSVNPGIDNVFSTAAFRTGHTLLPQFLQRLEKNGLPIPAGPLPLRNAFLNPSEIIDHDIDSILRGLAAQPAQEVDTFVVDDVRNFLFGPPGAGGFDLASRNIQRGRDHGLPGYNEVRRNYGLRPVSSFAEINPDPNVQSRLAAVYANIEDIDLWIGGLAETHVPGAMLGETFLTVIRDQFERVRDGDRFWFQAYLPQPLVKLVERQTLSTIIRRNTEIGRELRDNVFLVP